MRFSIRFMLLLTAAFAGLVSIGMAWRSFGAIIGPALFTGSFAFALVTACVRRPFAKWAFRSSLVVLALVVGFYLSMGPASWVMARYITTPNSTATTSTRNLIGQGYSHLYIPVATNAIYAPKPLRDLSFNYIHWWMPNNVTFEDMGQGIGWSEGRHWYTVISYRQGRPIPMP